MPLGDRRPPLLPRNAASGAAANPAGGALGNGSANGSGGNGSGGGRKPLAAPTKDNDASVVSWADGRGGGGGPTTPVRMSATVSPHGNNNDDHDGDYDDCTYKNSKSSKNRPPAAPGGGAGDGQQRRPRPRLRHDIAASSSMFALPTSWSSSSIRSSFGVEPAAPGEIDWLSLAVVYFITLVSEASRGLMLPSTWPYLESLGGTKTQLGVFVASFSLGRMATTVPLGYLSDNFSMATVLVIASLIQVLGHALYAVAPTVDTLIAARVIAGLGSATMSVCRAHVTRAVPSSKRTYHFAYLSALQFIGFAVLPGVGGLLAQLPALRLFGGDVILNGFTYPAYVLVLCNLLAVAAIGLFYLDPPDERRYSAPPSYGSMDSLNASTSPEASPPRSDSPTPLSAPRPGTPSTAPSMNSADAVLAFNQGARADTSGSSAGETVPMLSQRNPEPGASDSADVAQSEGPKPDTLALVVCLLVNVTFRGIIAELETVTTPFLMMTYGVGYDMASYYISFVGFLGLGVYLGFKPISKRFSDRSLVFLGLWAVVIGLVPLASGGLAKHMSLEMYVFFIGIIWSIAYPVGQTAVLSLFSKVLAGLPAGGFLGLFSMSGSAARIVFAVIAGKVWSMFGRDAVFATVLVYVLLSLLLVIVFYRRLIPPR